MHIILLIKKIIYSMYVMPFSCKLEPLSIQRQDLYTGLPSHVLRRKKSSNVPFSKSPAFSSVVPLVMSPEECIQPRWIYRIGCGDKYLPPEYLWIVIELPLFVYRSVSAWSLFSWLFHTMNYDKSRFVFFELWIILC